MVLSALVFAMVAMEAMAACDGGNVNGASSLASLHSFSMIIGMRSMLNMEENPKRRPFLTLVDDLIDEEFYDEQLLEKETPAHSRARLTCWRRTSEVENKLEPERKTQLAKKPCLQPRQVVVWFQNRQAR